MSNRLVDVMPRYSSADHGSVFKSLLTVVRNALEVPGNGFVGPHFDLALECDETLESCLAGEYDQLAYLNLEISLREDYWRLLYDGVDDSFRISPAPPQRRSALVLLDHKAEFLDMSPELREILSSASSAKKTIPLALATGMREVEFLANAVPDAWRRLAVQIGFSIEEAIRFQGFIQALMVTGQLWFRFEDLLEMFTDFVKKRELALIAQDRFRRLVDFFSAPSDLIESWGLPIPFVRFGNWLAYWPASRYAGIFINWSNITFCYLSKALMLDASVTSTTLKKCAKSIRYVFTFHDTGTYIS